MKRIHIYSLLALLGAMMMASCGGDSPQVEAGDKSKINVDSPLYGVYQLFKVNGNDVVIQGAGDLKIFDASCTKITIAGRPVYLYEFESKEDLMGVVATISPDGMKIGGKALVWAAGPPHFYRTDRVIVVYTGDEKEMTVWLAQVIGSQFAGAAA